MLSIGDEMDLRELKALEIAARSRVTFDGFAWVVPSQTGNGKYRVAIDSQPSCECDDFGLRQLPCKHIIAARIVRARDHAGKSPAIETDAVPKRKTYKQNWSVYNEAQATEKTRFQELLSDLCRGIEEPPRHAKAGKKIRMADRVFASAFKVFSTYSGRRFMSDLNDARDRGLIGCVMNPMTVMDFIESDEITPFLYQLIERSAWPLRAIETTFAPDSSGFSASRFVRWYDEKYGTERSGRAWVKAHVMTGATTNIITVAIVEGPNTGDCPQFKPLMERTIANGFKVNEVCGDKAYLSKENLELAAKHGAATYIPFKSNSTAGEPGSLWEKLFGFFQFNRADFLTRYHQRSNVESTFSMVKAKFRDSVRSKTDTAMKNEVLLKFLCHNLVVVHQAVLELGIAATFWPTKFDCQNQNANAGING